MKNKIDNLKFRWMLFIVIILFFMRCFAFEKNDITQIGEQSYNNPKLFEWCGYSCSTILTKELDGKRVKYYSTRLEFPRISVDEQYTIKVNRWITYNTNYFPAVERISDERRLLIKQSNAKRGIDFQKTFLDLFVEPFIDYWIQLFIVFNLIRVELNFAIMNRIRGTRFSLFTISFSRKVHLATLKAMFIFVWFSVGRNSDARLNKIMVNLLTGLLFIYVLILWLLQYNGVDLSSPMDLPRSEGPWII